MPADNSELPAVIDGFVQSGGCDLIIGDFVAGFAMEPFVGAYPDQRFSALDYIFDGDPTNARGVYFAADEPSFMAGYAAAFLTTTGAVGVFGGIQIPPVTLFMDGYALGVDYYNDQTGSDVQVVGWDPDSETGLFAGSFTDPALGYDAAQTLFDAGADTVLPVAGALQLGALEAAEDRKAAGDDVRVIGVDSDLYRQMDGDPSRVILTSVTKEYDVGVYHLISDLVKDRWEPGVAIENLKTHGVDLAPWHKLNRDVPGQLRKELRQIRRAIINGNITTTIDRSCADPIGCVEFGAGQPVAIAAALALTGPLSDVGIGELRGVELAAEQRVDLLGHTVSVSTADAECNPAGGTAAATSILSGPAVAGVVGTTCSASAATAAPPISDGGLTMVSPSNSLPFLTDPAFREDGYFRVSYNEVGQGERLAEYALSEVGAATAAVIARDLPPELAVDRPFVEAFADVFKAGGGTITTAVFDAPDPAAAIAAVVAAGVPDIVVFVAFEQSADLVIEIRSTPALNSTAIASSRDYLGSNFFAEAGPDAEGLYATAPTSPSGTAYDAFATAYQARYGVAPEGFDAYAYDAATVLLDAIERSGEIVGPVVRIGLQSVRDEMAATAGFDGASGTITCDPFGDCAADPSFDVFQVQGGAFVLVG